MRWRSSSAPSTWSPGHCRDRWSRKAAPCGSWICRRPHALRQKTRGRLWEWIPSLSVCKIVSYRALAIGFSIYTAGLLAGVLWSYRVNAGPIDFRTKQIGAVVAWVLFATLLQSYISGVYRARRTILISAGAFIATVVAMLGIHHA